MKLGEMNEWNAGSVVQNLFIGLFVASPLHIIFHKDTVLCENAKVGPVIIGEMCMRNLLGQW